MMTGPSEARAQAPLGGGCDYSECALRVKHSFFWASLVRGSEGEKVEGLRFWVSNLDPIFDGNTVSQDLAASFRRRQNAGSVLTFVGMAAIFVALEIEDTNSLSTDGGAVALVLSGLALAFTGAILGHSGRERLSKAVWEYNRTLAR